MPPFALMAAGAATASISNEPTPYTWAVHNFNGTCSAATCFAWDFKISGLGGPSKQPAFVANDCAVNNRNELEYQLCEGVEMSVPGTVGVQIYGTNCSGGLLSVQYIFQQQVLAYKIRWPPLLIIRPGDPSGTRTKAIVLLCGRVITFSLPSLPFYRMRFLRWDFKNEVCRCKRGLTACSTTTHVPCMLSIQC